MTFTQDPGERRLVRVIESSAVFNVADRLLRRVWRASGSSTAVGTATRAVRMWREAGLPLRHFGAGVALIVAVLVHMSLMLTGPLPPGWLWLVLPGLFAAVGLLLVAASRGSEGPAGPQ